MKNDLIVPDNIKGSRVKAFFTTKQRENDLTAIASEQGFSRVFMPRQKHTDHVYVLKEKEESIIADAVITAQKDILIGISVADCVPLVLMNETHDVVGVIHAGWRGTAAAITRKTIESVKENFNVQAEHIIMAIGPSIGLCCYNVGSEVIEKVTLASGSGDYVSTINNELFLNLKEANRIQAVTQGVKPHNISMSQSCTCCEKDMFFSYRCEGKTRQRQAGGIGMVGDR